MDDRLPEPIDPAAPPRRLLRAGGVVVVAGLFMLFLGVAGATNGRDHGAALVSPHTLLIAWLLSLPAGAVLLATYGVVARRRLRRFEARAGFLPREGRKELPKTGRKTLFRVEYGNGEEQLCLMIARWDYARSSGWRRAAVVEHAWVDADDAVAIGEQRARLTALAEELEEQLDDARLGGEQVRELADGVANERRDTRERTASLAAELARESR
jgi:hypothetical protein